MKQRIFLLLALMVAVTGAAFLGASSVSADRYSVAQLNARLENGFNTALSWDSNMGDANSCKSVTNRARLNGASISTLRNDYINESFQGRSPASYRSSTWLSKAAFPNTTNPVTVAYGATTIDLQINNMAFLCGTLVNPDVGTNCDTRTTASMYDDNRWVTNANPDSSPNPLGNSCLRPARTATNTRIEGITVTSTGAFGGTTNVRGGSLAVNRDSLSRYWFSSPVGIRYTFNAPVTTSGTIRLTLRVKRIQSYNTGVDRCQSGGESITVSSPTDFNRCDITTDSVALQIQPEASYNLQPSVSTSTTSVGNGENFTVSGSVRNTGGTASTSTNWRITKMYFAGSATPATPADGNGDACAAYTGYVAGSCQTLTQGSRGFAVGTAAVGTNTPDTADLARGARVCYATSVSTPTPNANPIWRYSSLRCVMISKKPKMQVHGGDVRVRGKIETSGSTFEGRQYGSWVEYAALLTGTSTGFGSGSGLNSGAIDTDPSSWNRLTFANVDNSGNPSFGAFTLPATTPLDAQFIAMPVAGAATGNLGSLGSGKYTAGNLTITSSTVGQTSGKGKKIVIHASGTVTITGDITYQGSSGDSFSNIEQIPQVVIIANKINIAGSVGRVDAWLLTRDSDASPSTANDAINTCSDVPVGAALTTSVCANPIIINGPVVTSHLYLRRTGGSGSTAATAGDPAEIFNLRADTYLWGRAQSAQNGKAQTVFSKELPPRF